MTTTTSSPSLSDQPSSLNDLRFQLQQIQKNSSSPRLNLSENTTVSILSLLLSHDILHTHNSSSNDDDKNDDTTTTEIIYGTNSLFKSILTYPQLVLELKNECQLNGGRISLLTASQQLFVDLFHVERAARTLVSSSSSSSDDFLLINKDVDLVSVDYLTQTMADLYDKLSFGCIDSSSSGRGQSTLPLGEASASLDLPSDVILTYWKGSVTAPPRRELATSHYHALKEAERRGVFHAIASRPWSKEELVDGYDEEMVVTMDDDEEVVEGIGRWSRRGEDVYIPNVFYSWQRMMVRDFYGSNGYVTEMICATMMKDCFVIGERWEDWIKSVLEGDEEEEEEEEEGLLLSLEGKKKGGGSVYLDPRVVLPPLEAAVEEAMSGEGFCDLGLVLPEPLWGCARDILRLLQQQQQDGDGNDDQEETDESSSRGLFLSSVEESGDCHALFMSPSMVTRIESAAVELAKEYGRSQAKEAIDRLNQRQQQQQQQSSFVMDDNDDNDDEGGVIVTTATTKSKKGKRGGKKKKGQQQPDDDQPPPPPESPAKTKLSAKEKRRQKKKSSSSQTTPTTTPTSSSSSHLIYPPSHLTSPLVSLYPDLSPYLTTLPSSWDDLDPSFPNPHVLSSLLHPLLSKISSNCHSSYTAEYDSLFKEHSKTIVPPPSKQNRRQIIKDFECHWPRLCARLRVLAKTMELQKFDDDETTTTTTADDDERERSFLTTVGADFARRVTQYKLWEMDVDGFRFTKDEEENPLHDYYFRTEVSPAPPHSLFPAVHLSYHATDGDDDADDDEKSKTTLQKMRDLLGDVGGGVPLARMWILLGGECYEGGTKIFDESDDGDGGSGSGGGVYVKKGNLEGFLKHVEEMSLSMCGLPFKMLDKKSEKQAMFSRRQELQSRLTDAVEPKEVFSLTIMLLFQQLKNSAIMGDDLTINAAYRQLTTKEDKIPIVVRDKLKTLKEALDNAAAETTTTMNVELVDVVKQCGLCRDITKFEG